VFHTIKRKLSQALIKQGYSVKF